MTSFASRFPECSRRVAGYDARLYSLRPFQDAFLGGSAVAKKKAAKKKVAKKVAKKAAKKKK
jgi:hypothetical protein